MSAFGMLGFLGITTAETLWILESLMIATTLGIRGRLMIVATPGMLVICETFGTFGPLRMSGILGITAMKETRAMDGILGITVMREMRVMDEMEGIRGIREIPGTLEMEGRRGRVMSGTIVILGRLGIPVKYTRRLLKKLRDTLSLFRY
jgi:hypothetical protein